MMSQRKRRPVAARTGSISAESDPTPIYRQTNVLDQEIANIKEGDQVRHKIMDYLNSGLPLLVLATDQYNALCSYTDELTKVPVIIWYEKAELIKMSSAADDQNED